MKCSVAIAAMLHSLFRTYSAALAEHEAHLQELRVWDSTFEEELLDDDVDEARREDLLAERDDLRAQLATKSREFLEQHRKADRILHQLHAQRQREKLERKQLSHAREALVELSEEAAAAAAAAAPAPSPNSTGHGRSRSHMSPGRAAVAVRSIGDHPVVAALEVSEHVTTLKFGKQAHRNRVHGSAKLDAVTEQGEQQERTELQVSELRHQDASLQQEIDSVKKASADELDKIHTEVHDMMLKAANTVHSLEDQADSLEEELEKEKTTYKEVASEDTKDKDTLMQETQAALNASQHVDVLSASLAATKKQVDDNDKQAAKLAATVTALREETARSQDTIQEVTADGAEVHGKVEAMQKSVDEVRAQVRKSATENAALRKEVAELMRKSRQADHFAEQLKVLQHEAYMNSSKADSLKQQIQRVQELKDHYSEELESGSNASATWQSKAEDLEHRLLASEQDETMLARQRDSAEDEVRQARTEANRYFDENQQLQEQREALEAKLREAKGASNQSETEALKLKAQAMKLRQDAGNEKDSSSQSWQSNQADLAEVKEEVQTAQILKDQTEKDLSRTKAVLTQEQKQLLGLLPKSGAQEAQEAPQAHSTPRLLAPSLPSAQHIVAQEVPSHAGRRASPFATASLGGGITGGGDTAKIAPSKKEGSTTAPKLVRFAGVPHIAAAAAGQHSGVVRVLAKPVPETPQLRGEPRRPKDSNTVAASMLASIDPHGTAATVDRAVAPTASTSARSTLQKLAAYFATPLRG